MLERVPSSRHRAANAVWYVAYSAGLGAAGFGVVAILTGYPAAFALVAALVLAAILSARLGIGVPLKP